MIIIVKERVDYYTVYPKNDTELRESGSTLEEAAGRLVIMLQEQLGIMLDTEDDK